MIRTMVFHRKKIWVIFAGCILLLIGLATRLVYLMGVQSDYYIQKADDLHERERDIKAARGKILDVKGNVLADNRTVCTISVIHSQIKEPEKVIRVLKEQLSMDEETVRKKVEKVSSIERIKTNVDKTIGDAIREYALDGVKVDEDYRRYYPYGSLASKVMGFTGGDNQGIIGLEVKYDEILAGQPGKILTVTDARGMELDGTGERRKEPIAGDTLRTSLDISIQEYVQQAALKVMEEKQAERVSVLLMNPQNGEIYACVNVPEFDLNDPFTLNTAEETVAGTDSGNSKQDLLNQMWRNPCLNDTYEPGSTFKIITMAAGLEAGVVSTEDRFFCPGYKVVEDRRIHCAKRTGHGAQNFVEGAQNSCNPVFIEVGLRLGVDRYYKYFKQFGLLKKTGIDLPGEAGTIMHNPKIWRGGTRHSIFWPVFPDHAGSACNYGQFCYQRWEQDHAPLRDQRGKRRRNADKYAGISGGNRNPLRRNIRNSTLHPGKSSIRRFWKKCRYRRLFHRRKNSNFTDTSQRFRQVYFLILRVRTCRESHSTGALYHLQSTGNVLWRNYRSPVIRSIFENILPYLGIEKKSSGGNQTRRKVST